MTFACVQNEVLRTNLIGNSNNNQIGNQITNTFSNTMIERKNHRISNNTKTKDAILISSFNELTTTSSTLNSIQQQQTKPEYTDFLDNNNLLPATEYNNNNKLFNQEDSAAAVHPTDDDNLPAAVRSNEHQSSWPNQINELPSDFKTHISNPNQAKSIEPFKDWNSFCQYIESE